jgi:hypothetical protein
MRRNELKEKMKFFLHNNDYEDRKYILFCDGSGPKFQKTQNNLGYSAYVLYNYKEDKIKSSYSKKYYGNSFECEMNALYHGVKYIRFIKDKIYIFIDNITLFNTLMNKDVDQFTKIDKIKIKELLNIFNSNSNLCLVSVNRKFVEIADLVMRN